MPLSRVRGLAQRTTEAIVAERARQPFVDLPDLLERVRIPVDQARALILSGACDGLGASRPAMLWQLAIYLRQRPAGTAPGADQTPSLFAGVGPREEREVAGASEGGEARPCEQRRTVIPGTEHVVHPNDSMAAHNAAMAPDADANGGKDTLAYASGSFGRGAGCGNAASGIVTTTTPSLMLRAPSHPLAETSAHPKDSMATNSAAMAPGSDLPAHLLEDYDRSRLRELERQYLGCSPADHPLAEWADQLAGLDVVRSIDIGGFVGRSVRVAGIIVAKRRAVTRRRELMQFVTLEDRWGLLEVVLFPDTYRQLAGTVGSFGPYLVAGTVQENMGSVVLIGRSVEPLAALSSRTDGRHLRDSARPPRLNER